MAERDSFLIARLAPKNRESILDIGCGDGEDLERIARDHRGGHLVGMDKSEQMVRRARRRLARRIKAGRAELVIGDANKGLPFESRQFDAVYSVELLECLSPSGRLHLMNEIHRVLRPRGRVVLAHTDWDTQIWNASNPTLERKLIHAFCDWTQGWMEFSDGWMGRKLLGLLRRSGLFRQVELDVHVLAEDQYKPGAFGYARAHDFLTLARQRAGIRAADAKMFVRDLQARHRAKEYFYSVNRYVLTARRA